MNDETKRKARVGLAWALIVATLIGWPYSLLVTDEPPFVLSLSWLAITLTAYDILQSSHVRNEQENPEES